LLEEIKFMIYMRSGHPVDLSSDNPMLPKTFLKIDPKNNLIGMISSTEVRTRIKEMKKQSEGRRGFEGIITKHLRIRRIRRS